MQAALLHGVLRLDECHLPIILCDQPPFSEAHKHHGTHTHTQHTACEWSSQGHLSGGRIFQENSWKLPSHLYGPYKSQLEAMLFVGVGGWLMICET